MWTQKEKLSFLSNLQRKIIIQLLWTFFYQVMRACHVTCHPAVIHRCACNHTGQIDGVIAWHTFRDVLSSDGKHMEISEEKTTIDDLASYILEFIKKDTFKPCTTNRNDPTRNMCRDQTEVINQKHCYCEFNAVNKIVNTKKGDQGRNFWYYPKYVNNISNCKYFRWKHD